MKRILIPALLGALALGPAASPIALGDDHVEVIDQATQVEMSPDDALHRLIDGREAVTALKIIKEAIEDPTRMLIDL